MKLDAVTDGVLSKIDDLGFKQEALSTCAITDSRFATVIRSISKSAGKRISRGLTCISAVRHRGSRCIFL